MLWVAELCISTGPIHQSKVTGPCQRAHGVVLQVNQPDAVVSVVSHHQSARSIGSHVVPEA